MTFILDDDDYSVMSSQPDLVGVFRSSGDPDRLPAFRVRQLLPAVDDNGLSDDLCGGPPESEGFWFYDSATVVQHETILELKHYVEAAPDEATVEHWLQCVRKPVESTDKREFPNGEFPNGEDDPTAKRQCVQSNKRPRSSSPLPGTAPVTAASSTPQLASSV